MFQLWAGHHVVCPKKKLIVRFREGAPLCVCVRNKPRSRSDLKTLRKETQLCPVSRCPLDHHPVSPPGKHWTQNPGPKKTPTQRRNQDSTARPRLLWKELDWGWWQGSPLWKSSKEVRRKKKNKDSSFTFRVNFLSYWTMRHSKSAWVKVPRCSERVSNFMSGCCYGIYTCPS